MNQKKNIFFIVTFIIISVSCNTKLENNKNLSNGNLSSLLFIKELHDFGEIPANKNATAIFNFSNSGERPLVISEVKTSCGCTVPEYPKDIIKSGKSGQIKVIYDAKYPGRFKKTITLFYNGKDSPKTLTIKGEVPYPKETDSIIK